MNAKKIAAKAYLWLLLIVLYAPIAFIVIFSFTEAKSLGNWTGFSTQLYRNLFSGSMQNASGLLSAVYNTLKRFRYSCVENPVQLPSDLASVNEKITMNAIGAYSTRSSSQR